MRYRYVVAYSLVGIIRPNEQLEGVVIELPAAGVLGTLTGNLESIPIEVDQATAVGSQMLRALVGQAGEGTPEERIAKEVDEIRQRRIREAGQGALLLVEATGEVEDFSIDPQRELAGFVCALCDSPKSDIRNRYESAVHGLLAALALASEHLCGVKKIADQVTFLRDDGTTIFCFSLSGSGRGYVSSPMSEQALPVLLRHARTLSRHQSLVDTARLLTRSLAEEGDPLLSFLSVWSGLEIFVNKNFKEYEGRVLVRLSAGDPPVVPNRLAERIRAVMSDKYRLADKFSVIAAELLDPETDKDQTSFESIKVARDRLLHGEDVALDALPTADAQRLLRKYLRLHLQQVSNRERG